MLRAALVLMALSLAACASMSRGRRCAPIDPEVYLDYGGLYDECTVEQRARLSHTPRFDYPYAAPRNVSCLVGILEFIVDTTGKPLPQTAQVVAANDQRYVELMFNYLAQLRYAPGKVKDRPVHQITRWEARTPVQMSRTTARADPTQRSSC